MAVGNGNPKHKWQSHNSILKKGNSVTKASGKVSFSRSPSVSSCWVMISPLYYSVKMEPRLGCIIGWNWPKGEERNQITVWSSFTQRGRRSGSCGGGCSDVGGVKIQRGIVLVLNTQVGRFLKWTLNLKPMWEFFFCFLVHVHIWEICVHQDVEH